MHRRVPVFGRTFALLMLFASMPHAWSQQSSLFPPILTGKADLPDAPLAQATPQIQGPLQSASANQPSPASIHGVVVDRDRAVYEGVRVQLKQAGSIASPAGAASEKSSTSDANGRFSFEDLPPGPFTLTASSTGFATRVISVILHSGENYEAPAIVLLLAGATSDVQVTASRFDVAEEQLKDEEQQRVLGVIPNFYVVYAPDAPPLNSKQKYRLALRTAIDPITLLATAGFAGVEQANDDFRSYGQGTEGYAKRFGANYADSFIGNMLGGAVLPSLLKQDPRYFYKGTGTIRSRAFYAIANAVICKGDNGHWQFDYSGVIGGLAAAGISNLYYPAADRNGASLTFENALLGTAGSAIGNLFQEFLVRKLTPKIPNYGSPKP